MSDRQEVHTEYVELAVVILSRFAFTDPSMVIVIFHLDKFWINEARTICNLSATDSLSVSGGGCKLLTRDAGSSPALSRLQRQTQPGRGTDMVTVADRDGFFV